MKKGCRNCKFGEKVTDEQKKYALKVQAIRAKKILNKDKVKEIKALSEYEKFSNIVGLEDMVYNDLPVEIQGVDIYRICTTNEQVLCDDVHKTYYVCEYWEDEND